MYLSAAESQKPKLNHMSVFVLLFVSTGDWGKVINLTEFCLSQL